jgi:hypothetical protein
VGTFVVGHLPSTLCPPPSELYTHQVETEDPDAGDFPRFSLATASRGVTISTMGVLEWLPSPGQLGTHGVTVVVMDREDAPATQSFVVQVEEENFAPEIISSPILSATQSSLYQHQVLVSDENAPDGLRYELLVAPPGMTVGRGGLITWTPSPIRLQNG